jgi:hypothetical protein
MPAPISSRPGAKIPANRTLWPGRNVGAISSRNWCRNSPSGTEESAVHHTGTAALTTYPVAERGPTGTVRGGDGVAVARGVGPGRLTPARPPLPSPCGVHHRHSSRPSPPRPEFPSTEGDYESLSSEGCLLPGVLTGHRGLMHGPTPAGDPAAGPAAQTSVARPGMSRPRP